MRRNLNVLFTLALITCAAVAYADPPARIGRLNYVSGTVSIASAEAPDQWIQAVLNRPLTSGDRLWADNDSRAELHVGPTAVRMGPQTSFDVLNLDDRTMQLRLGQGSINLRARQLSPDETIEIATPTAAVIIRRPGSYRVSADPHTDVSRVTVNFGQAEIVTPAQTFTVPSGQIAVIPESRNVSFEIVASASRDEFDRWSAERDRREDRIVSKRYVSPQMTGYEDLDQYGSWRTHREYGAVWYPTGVATDWAPYRNGHWTWVSPWGWTWVDEEPWGFAPFHYGRWVYVDRYWGWAPGRVVSRPVYAPALVAFLGGPNWSASISSGPAVGWFPLGFRDPYVPWYRASPTYVRNVNLTHVRNLTNVINIHNNSTNVARINYAYRNIPQAVTIVPQSAFVSARPVRQATIGVAPTQLAQAQVIHARPPAEPPRAGFVPGRAGHRPPPAASAREVFAVTSPPRPAAQANFAPGGETSAPRPHEPRVRVIGRGRGGVDADNRREPQVGGFPFRAPQASAPSSTTSGIQQPPTPPGPASLSKGPPQRPASPFASQTAPATPRAPQTIDRRAEERQPGPPDRVSRGAGSPAESRRPPPTAPFEPPMAPPRAAAPESAAAPKMPPQQQPSPPVAGQATAPMPRAPLTAGRRADERQPGPPDRVTRGAGAPAEQRRPPSAAPGEPPRGAPSAVARPPMPMTTQPPATPAPRGPHAERPAPKGPPAAAPDRRAANEARGRPSTERH